jgi:hypothetical protein
MEKRHKGEFCNKIIRLSSSDMYPLFPSTLPEIYTMRTNVGKNLKHLNNHHRQFAGSKKLRQPMQPRLDFSLEQPRSCQSRQTFNNAIIRCQDKEAELCRGRGVDSNQSILTHWRAMACHPRATIGELGVRRVIALSSCRYNTR